MARRRRKRPLRDALGAAEVAGTEVASAARLFKAFMRELTEGGIDVTVEPRLKPKPHVHIEIDLDDDDEDEESK